MDDELERLKQKRLMEMQRQMLLKQIKGQEHKPEPAKEPTHDEILGRRFGDRAWEVWNAAKAQYPQAMPQVEKLLVDAINQGKVKQTLDGASLMGFFRQIGIPVRLATRIRISEHGELKTLEQKMKEEG
ncbi:MAG TPA: DNA-binding protein [Candidatus Bathyarchaeia archaeon]|jgi:DNA-binding TFAR19-related protein (PDSD5 family)